MSVRFLRIMIYGTLGFLFLFIGTGIYQTHFIDEVESYVEVQHSLYKISNQCIADYYANELTADGRVISFYSKIEDCGGKFITKSSVKIFDTDTKQQHRVKAYQLHGVMINKGANSCFMDRVIMRRLDNDKIINDITDDFRGRHPEEIVESSFLSL